ncbi:MAG: pitrilysin family protein [Polyangiaceae bacterium]
MKTRNMVSFRCMASLFALASASMLVGCQAASPLVVPPPTVAYPKGGEVEANVVATPPAVEAEDAPFRASAPPAGPKPAFRAPKVETATLANGIPVYFVEQSVLPIVSFRLVVRMEENEGERPGLTTLLGTMLDQGTSKHSAEALSDAFEAIGAEHSTFFEWDSGGIAVKVPAAHWGEGLDLAAEALLDSTIPEDELERVRARRLTGLKQQKMSLSAMASNAAAAALYGRAHPYGHSLSGREEDTKAATRDELLKLKKRLIVPSRLGIVASGAVKKDELVARLNATLGKLPRGGAGPAKRAPAPSPTKARVVLVDRPGATQSQVYLTTYGVVAGNPERDALSVMNAAFGGSFSSRVNLNLREKHAYTYGARSYFLGRKGRGPFLVGGAIFTDKTAAAIDEILLEVEAMRTTPLTAEELELAKESIRLGLPGRFESVSAITAALAELMLYRLPLDEYTKKADRIGAVKGTDVQKLAQKYLVKDKLIIVVAGDRSKIESSLAKFGPIEIRDAFGDVVTGDAAAAKPEEPPVSHVVPKTKPQVFQPGTRPAGAPVIQKAPKTP